MSFTLQCPLTWQSRWEGPEDPLQYLRGLVARTLAIQVRMDYLAAEHVVCRFTCRNILSSEKDGIFHLYVISDVYITLLKMSVHSLFCFFVL